jgi:hypothetical protein
MAIFERPGHGGGFVNLELGQRPIRVDAWMDDYLVLRVLNFAARIGRRDGFKRRTVVGRRTRMTTRSLTFSHAGPKPFDDPGRLVTKDRAGAWRP